MQWFLNLKCAYKLVALFAVVLMAVLVNNVLALLEIRTINQQAGQIITRSMPEIYYLGAMQSNLNEMRIAELRHVMEDSSGIMAAVKRRTRGGNWQIPLQRQRVCHAHRAGCRT